MAPAMPVEVASEPAPFPVAPTGAVIADVAAAGGMVLGATVANL